MNSTVNVNQISATDGSVTSTITIPGTDSTDIGGLAALDDGETVQAYFTGSTGGESPAALIGRIVYGVHLQSLNLPTSVQGGSNLSEQLNLTATPTNPFIYKVISNLPLVVGPASGSFSTQMGTVTSTTYPVDADTLVTVTGLDYFGNVQRSAGVTITAAVLNGLSSSATTFNPSQTAMGTITLNGPAGPSGKVVSLSSTDPSITVPASAKVLAGNASVNFTISSHPVSAATSPTITATFGAQTFTKQVSVLPAPLKSLSVTSSSLPAGGSTTGEVIISTQAGPTGDVVTVRSNMSAVTVPATVTIPAGGTYVMFSIKANGVTTSTVVTLSALFNGVTKYSSVTVSPTTLSGVSVAPTSVKGGTNAEATVTLSGPTGAAGYMVTLSSSSSSVTLPASLTFPAGASSYSFLVKTKAVTTSTPVTITATVGATMKTTTLTLTP
jgi:hypothetical protein